MNGANEVENGLVALVRGKENLRVERENLRVRRERV